MQFTLDGTTIFTSVVGALWLVCSALVGLWVRRIQKDAEADRDQLSALRKDLADFREKVARECASRDEVKDERREMREVLQSIDRKLADLNNKLDSKMDKS